MIKKQVSKAVYSKPEVVAPATTFIPNVQADLCRLIANFVMKGVVSAQFTQVCRALTDASQAHVDEFLKAERTLFLTACDLVFHTSTPSDKALFARGLQALISKQIALRAGQVFAGSPAVRFLDHEALVSFYRLFELVNQLL